MQHLKIAIIQTDIVWQNAKQNRIQYADKISLIEENVDIVVLPEMFSTGFSMEPVGISETMEGETIKWMKNLASEKNAAICGSLIISEDDNFLPM